MNKLECLEEGEECLGQIEYRYPLSATGVSFPRCSYHWNRRLVEQERINQDYQDSPFSPDWFDPMNAGEYWEEDY